MSNLTDIKDSSSRLGQSAGNDDNDAQYHHALSCLCNHITQYNLALYYNNEKTEKNLERTFYWIQKAAEGENKKVMNRLAKCYKNGEGTEKNLEKSFY